MTDSVEIWVLSSSTGKCIAINGHRVAGGKPWGSGGIALEWKTTKGEILASVGVRESDIIESRTRIEKLDAENAELQSKVNMVRLAAKYSAKIRDDHIDKLEAALREIINKDSFSMDWAIRTARKALEGEDD